jgi:uncharacterized protein (DUF952 family)
VAVERRSGAEPVLHLATPEAWTAAEASGRVSPPSLEAEGFIHCSTAAQVAGTIRRHFEGIDELCLLELDLTAVGADLRWEESRPGEVYPHLYRPLLVEEVARVVPWHRSPDGSVAVPPGLA